MLTLVPRAGDKEQLEENMMHILPCHSRAHSSHAMKQREVQPNICGAEQSAKSADAFSREMTARLEEPQRYRRSPTTGTDIARDGIDAAEVAFNTTVASDNTLRPASSSFYKRKPGDANGDGAVDKADFTIWYDNRFGTGTWTQGDFNRDGHIDGQDFIIWNANRQG